MPTLCPILSEIPTECIDSATLQKLILFEMASTAIAFWTILELSQIAINKISVSGKLTQYLLLNTVGYLILLALIIYATSYVNSIPEVDTP